jgi:hypothetical protein
MEQQGIANRRKRKLQLFSHCAAGERALVDDQRGDSCLPDDVRSGGQYRPVAAHRQRNRVLEGSLTRKSAELRHRGAVFVSGDQVAADREDVEILGENRLRRISQQEERNVVPPASQFRCEPRDRIEMPRRVGADDAVMLHVLCRRILSQSKRGNA